MYVDDYRVFGRTDFYTVFSIVFVTLEKVLGTLPDLKNEGLAINTCLNTCVEVGFSFIYVVFIYDHTTHKDKKRQLIFHISTLYD